MDRPYRLDRDRDRDRDRDHFRDRDNNHNHNNNYRDRDRDRDRDFPQHQSRRPSRFSDAPPPPDHRRSPRAAFSGGHDHRRSPRGGGGFSGGPPPHPPPSDHRRSPRGPIGGPPEELWQMRGGVGGYGGNNNDGDFRRDFVAQRPAFPQPNSVNPSPNFPQLQRPPPVNQLPQRPPLQHPPVNHQPPPPAPPQLSGQKRGFPFSGHGGGSPEHSDGKSYVKLFVGSVPRTATEEEIRPLFDEQGAVLEVAFIKDKRTGQQQGCCFIKYATSEEADRAIRALHNQYTLPGGAGPIQVRYADGERERIGNVEYKLFVGAMNKFATEKEVEEIFVSFGRIEDVYLMRDERNQSRGCGFVKFSNKESAMAAVNALNGIYVMRGCDQPLTVRFADPKRPRAGEPRAGPASGSPGFGPSPSPGIRPAPGPNIPDPNGGLGPPNAWHPWSPPNMGPSSNGSMPVYGNQFPPRSGEAPNLSIPGGHTGARGGIIEGSFVGSMPASSTSPQNFDQSFPQAPPSGQQISSLQNSRESPQHFATAVQLHQGPGSYSQAPTSQSSMRPPSQLQSGVIGTYSQPSKSNQVHSQPRPNTASSLTNSQLTTTAAQPLPFQQSPSHLAQMLSQQTQTLQASFQSSQQAFSQLQQQVQMMQPSTQNQLPRQGFQASKQQWAGASPTTAVGASHVRPNTDALPSASSDSSGAAVAAKTAPAKCDWTEHTSPAGHKYYYNSATGESRWEKPLEMTVYEQQQQQQQQQHKLVVQPPHAQPNLQANPTQQPSQSQPSQQQAQFHSANHLQQPQLSSFYPTPRGLGNQIVQEKTYQQSLTPDNSVNDPARFQQGYPVAQQWPWNNSRGN